MFSHDRRCREHIAGSQAGRRAPGGILARQGWAPLSLVPSRFGLCKPDSGAWFSRTRPQLVLYPLARRRRHRVWLGFNTTARVWPNAHCSFRQDPSPASGAVSAASSVASDQRPRHPVDQRPSRWHRFVSVSSFFGGWCHSRATSGNSIRISTSIRGTARSVMSLPIPEPPRRSL